MTLHILSQQNTVLNKFIAQIRDKRIQQDSMRFRRNMERIGEIMAYEISREFAYKAETVETPLGEAVSRSCWLRFSGPDCPTTRVS